MPAALGKGCPWSTCPGGEAGESAAQGVPEGNTDGARVWEPSREHGFPA
ncbi:hypothetical protein [Streptomyces sp. DSM 15324]|nr:hypothetical protein [Streptomyces sp. DSM 15324]